MTKRIVFTEFEATGRRSPPLQKGFTLSFRELRSRKTLAAAAAFGAFSLFAAAATVVPAATASAATNNNGTINWEWPLPTSWDPVASTAGTDVHALSLVYAAITTLSPAGNAEPSLAKSWKYSDGGKAITFVLRPGLKFSDGTPLNATAVKENIQRGISQANSGIASQLAVISSVTVNSPTSFTFNLSEVDYQIPNLMAGKDGMIVSPATFNNVGGLATQPVGAGPFKLTSYVPDSHANLVRNPGYWDASQIHLSNFTIQQILDPQQILSALESGQVNVASIPGNLVAAAKSAGLKIDVIPSLTVTEIDTQITSAPLNNPKVVEAINYAIDRQALVQVEESGYGSVSYQPFPKGYVGYNPALANLYPYNPTKAKQLLAQAGGSASITLSNFIPADVPLAEQIQSQLQAVGFKVTIATVPEATATTYLYVDKSLAFAIDGTAGRESPLAMLDVLYDQAGLMDVIGKAGKEPATVASALNSVAGIPLNSPKYPKALQAAVKTAVTKDPIHTWLFYSPRIFAYSPKVTGIPSDLVQQRWEGVQVSG
jgi:peptide/nickel transport system substrate-binding protein